MVVNSNSSESEIVTVQSPSITQETKARFNELLKAALSKEAQEPLEFKSPRSDVSKFVGVPKVVPRKKIPIKNPPSESNVERFREIFSTSSEESSGYRKRQIIAEVHSSRTQLLQSSSDDDILSEKKTKKRKKKTRLKQVAGSVELNKERGQDNPNFQKDGETFERSSSRLSNRSYVLETPTVPVENLISVGVNNQSGNTMSPSRSSNRSYTIETPTITKEDLESLARSDFLENHDKHQDSMNNSPSRMSSRSYTLEMPTVLSNAYENEKTTSSKIPVPLPRRKSLKSSETGQVCVENEVVESIMSKHESSTRVEENTPRTDITNLESQAHHTEDDAELPLRVRKQKRKKKRRKRSESREKIEMQELSVHSVRKKSPSLTVDKTKSTPSVKSLIEASDILDGKTIPSPIANEGAVGVTVHGVDYPIIDPMVRHPMVCVYIVDTSIGELYRKSDPTRSVCYLGENTSYIPPIMTHMYDFKQHKSVVPVWNECLLLNEPASRLLTTSTLMLLELCDVVPPAVASARHASQGEAAGRHIVAWAFLRPVTPDSRRLRLQLYKPGRWRQTRPLTPVVYEWWGSATRTKYPGSLYVTISEVESPAVPSPCHRSQSALQGERGSQASVSAGASATDSDQGEGEDIHQESFKGSRTQWSRLPGQSCKVPNACVQRLPVEGSMSVRFSDNGLWLACGRQDIQVFSVPQFTHTTTLTGHQGLVYCLRWSPDSKVLLSASADCTVCVWRPLTSRNPLMQMLAHPTFVYCAQFVLMQPLTLVSGCCDTVVRVWQGRTHNSYQLMQELTGHMGFITSLCMSVDGSKVVSADSLGVIRVYDVEEDGSLSAGRELRVREVRGTAISNVVSHPGGHRLIVHCRDSTIRGVDLATGAVLHSLKGCVSERMQTGVCVSACGGLVLGCGEDGALIVWDGHTGALRAMYCGLLPPGSAGIHYHPHDYFVAVVSLAQPPMFILGFDRNATGEDIGLHLLKNEITASDVIERMKQIKNLNKWQKTASKVLHRPHSSVSVANRIFGRDKGKRKSGNGEEANMKDAKGGVSVVPGGNWPSLPQLIGKSSGEKDLLLLEIIRKMDSMILAAKQSSQSHIQQ